MLHRVWSTSSQLIFQIEKSNVELWHKIMGHIGFQGLHDLSKVRSSKGMPYISVIIKTCDACMLGKQHKDCIKKNTTRTTRENVHVC
jgi:hypothetical protein